MKPIICALALSLMCFQWAFSQDIRQKAELQATDLLSLYKELHQYPEISFHEEKTSARLADLLKSFGYEVMTGIANTYAIAGIMKNGEGPVVLIRTDMDALPIKEETGLPYASKYTNTDSEGNVIPAMHACGHDIHMTSWVGTAKLLAATKDQWKGTVIMFGQPAEERGGARFLFRKNLFGGILPVPDYCIALHANATLPAGVVGHCPGPSFASTDMIDITVFGKGGHGAFPHQTIDPIVLAARMIMDFQTIVSREIAPTDPAVVTVGSIHGGSKHNIIPSEVKMELTIRAYTETVRNKILEALQRIATGVAMSAGLSPDKYPTIYVREEGVPATVNDKPLTERLIQSHMKLLGEEQVLMVEPLMGGEDFSMYGLTKEKVPICIFWLGTVAETTYQQHLKDGSPLPPIHSPFYAPDPLPSLTTGIAAMTGAALELLGK